jgi:pimeloyl-ACP methyl ester carboxylesterase
MKLLLSVLRITLGVALLAPLALYLLQDRLLFFPQPLDAQIRAAVLKTRADAEEVRIKTPDQITLHGWFVKNSKAAKAPVLIYFGGNAEEVSGVALDAEHVPGISMLFVNYRGYGVSGGVPGEAALFSDAITLYEYLARRADVDIARTVVMGRSLGSGVGVYLAAQRPVRAVILVTPYDSMTAVAQGKYPFVPVSLLLRHPFDSYSRAPSIKAPVLALLAQNDTLIPAAHAHRLIANWGGRSDTVVLEGVEHDDVNFHERYWAAIADFLKQNNIP